MNDEEQRKEWPFPKISEPACCYGLCFVIE
jgi:hypothetical protein